MYTRQFGEAEHFAHTGSYYIDFLRLLDIHLAPRGYLEIGTDTGLSLNCFTCDAVCVDPDIQVAARVWQRRRRTLLYQTTSDDFFAREDVRALFGAGPDIVFLDGMHRAEFLLRDFTNTERAAHRRTLVLIHDCLPLNPRMAARVARRGEESEGIYRDAWTGDVWRVLFALQAKRPDLHIRYLDCPPTGLIAISNLDPASTVLFDAYEELAALMQALELSEEQLRTLWRLHPLVDTAALAANPADISAVLNCH